MTTSSITAALPGTASSTSRGQSCPSVCAIGHIGPDQRDLVLVQKGGWTSLGIEDAHLTAQYIDELGQGIHTRILEHLPNLGRFTSPGWDRVFRIMDQGSETQHLKPTAPAPIQVRFTKTGPVLSARTASAMSSISG